METWNSAQSGKWFFKKGSLWPEISGIGDEMGENRALCAFIWYRKEVVELKKFKFDTTNKDGETWRKAIRNEKDAKLKGSHEEVMGK